MSNILTEGETAMVQSLIAKLACNQRERTTLEKELKRLENREQTREVMIRIVEILTKILDLNESSNKTRDELEQLMEFTLKNVGVDTNKLDYHQQIAEFKKIARV